jgi:hypothetical protein
VSLGLPAPISVGAVQVKGSISYLIGRDGRVRRVPGAQSQSPFPLGAIFFPGTGTWFQIRDRHLIVGRGRTSVWRSHREIASRWQLGLVTVGPQTVAFQHDHKLYLAPISGAERPVASREMPLGWTGGGLYTYRYQGHELLLRSDAGTLLKTIARQPLGSDYFVMNGRLYFISHGVLERAHGMHTQRLVSLASLRMTDPWLQPLGSLLELQDNSRLLVLRPDGSVFARTPLPRSDGAAESMSSSLVVAPDGSAVAFAAAAGEASDPNAAHGARGTESVYLLRARTRMAVPVHTETVSIKVGERGAGLQWHGNWLLYSNTEGSLAAIDTTGAHHTIELSAIAHSLPGADGGFSASWARLAGHQH